MNELTPEPASEEMELPASVERAQNATIHRYLQVIQRAFIGGHLLQDIG